MKRIQKVYEVQEDIHNLYMKYLIVVEAVLAIVAAITCSHVKCLANMEITKDVLDNNSECLFSDFIAAIPEVISKALLQI